MTFTALAPAKAGTQGKKSGFDISRWNPACAGMSGVCEGYGGNASVAVAVPITLPAASSAWMVQR